MLCAPPMCAPATHFLGCFSLKQGASVVLAVDSAYGLGMVVLHALLLSEVKEPADTVQMAVRAGVRMLQNSRPSSGGIPFPVSPAEGTAEEEEERGEAEPGFGGGAPGAEGQLPMRQAADFRSQSAGESSGQIGGQVNQITGWFLQLMDLDFGFGHRMLGLPDQTLMTLGLVYGILTLLVSAYMFQAVVCGTSSMLPHTSRMFTSFLHLQILLYVFISLCKLPKLCAPIQSVYLTHLYMECDVFYFIYIERTIMITIAASFLTWIFASFSFVLTFGHGAHQAVDRPEFQQHLELGLPPASKGGPGGLASALPPRPGGLSALAPSSRHNLGGMVGPAVGTFGGGGAYSMVGGGGDRGAASRFPSSYANGAQQGTSYSIGRTLPRNSSSMATSTTASHAEHHPLIKPPVAVY